MSGWDQEGSGGGGAHTHSHDTEITDVSPDDHHTEIHGGSHQTGGTDPLTPAAIGAAEDDHTHDEALGIVFTSSARTFALTDLGKLIGLTGSTARTFTIPPASSVSWPLGAVLHVMQYGSGTLTIAEGSGVNLHGPIAIPSTNRSLSGQYAQATLVMVSADNWVISGDLD